MDEFSQPKKEETTATKHAVSLEYDGKTTPTITASGSHSIAEEILSIAKTHNIPIYENKSLIEILSRMEVGDEIPKELYLIIAQLIAFVYHLKGLVPKENKTSL